MPHIFKQMLVIAGYYKGRFMDLAYVLMTKRRTEDYTRVLESLPLSNDIEYIQVDFEMAQLNAIKEVLLDMQLNVNVHLVSLIFAYI